MDDKQLSIEELERCVYKQERKTNTVRMLLEREQRWYNFLAKKLAIMKGGVKYIDARGDINYIGSPLFERTKITKEAKNGKT